jgi:hypothetical protein
VHNMLKIASLKQQQKVKMNEYEEGLNVCAWYYKCYGLVT